MSQSPDAKEAPSILQREEQKLTGDGAPSGGPCIFFLQILVLVSLYYIFFSFFDN
jgi:hypothetical protein